MLFGEPSRILWGTGDNSFDLNIFEKLGIGALYLEWL